MIEPSGYCSKCDCTGNLWELDGRFVTRVRTEDAERVKRVQCHVCEKPPSWWIDLKARYNTAMQVEEAQRLVRPLQATSKDGTDAA